MTKSHLLLALLALAFLAACALSLLLYRQAMTFYQREAEVRLRPIDTRFANYNAALAAQPKTKPRIVIFGESRAAMWRSSVPKNWGDLEFVNRGIGGETTAQIRLRLEADVLALDPDLVILQMGDNDIKTIAVLPPSRKEQIVAETEQNIRSIATTIADRGIPVIVTTIFPPAPPELARRPIWSSEINAQIDHVNARLLNWSHPNVTVADCDAILRRGAHIDPAYAIDTLHLNQAGYEALNLALEPTIKAYLAE